MAALAERHEVVAIELQATGARPTSIGRCHSSGLPMTWPMC
jgi:hypothetical protein